MKKDNKLDKKTQKALNKKAKGKDLSKKEQKRVSLLNITYKYRNNKEYALRLKNVKRSFGMKKVLKGVTLDVKKGERIALLGKNGSGKSTLINIISQQLKMSQGAITYGYAKSRAESLEFLGIQFQTLNYPEGFVVKDVVHFFNASVEKSIRMSKRELEDMVSMFGIDKFLDQKIDRLSGGQQQRVNVLLALIKKPKLLILDEISTGLDVESAETIKEYIDMYLKKSPETSLILVSHNDEEIREMTTKAYVLEAGKVVEEFASEKLTHNKFLEITSRDPKLTKKEIEAIEKESEKHIKSLKRAYRLKDTNAVSEKASTVNNNISKKFNNIDNTQIEGNNIVEVRDVSKTYGGKVGAVRQLSLDIKEGERVAITGPNGSGKTTIVEIIAQVKTFDKKSKKYDNMLSLAKVDHERAVKKLNEDISLELRRFKNSYRLHRELVNLEIDELKKTKSDEVKKNKDKITSSKKLSEKEKEEQISKSSANIRKKIDKKIDTLTKDLEVYIDKKHKEYAELEKRLNKDLESSVANEQLLYDVKVQDILNQKDDYKKEPGTIRSQEYVKDGELIPFKTYKETKPPIAYSFSNTPRGVKDWTGVQFQYASFPVEMSVLDVILFFARTNKNHMSKPEMLEAVKVFKLEKLLKTKAFKLSGGERQRLNVLLSIMKSPKLLILDEISTGLDVDSVIKIDHFINDYLNRTGATLILISHNYNEVHSLTDKIIVMKYGQLSEIVNTKGWTLAKTKDKMRDIYKGGGI